jgi:hypothetical protein
MVKLQLISRSGSTKNQEFFIEDIYKLNELINLKEKEIISVKNDFKNLIKNIEKHSEEVYKSNNIEIFEGKDGYFLWMEKRLKGNHKVIKELGSIRFLSNFLSGKDYDKYMTKHIAKRVKKGILMLSLFDINEPIDPEDKLNYTHKDLIKETRQFPGALELGAFLEIYGDYFGYFTIKNDKFMGVVIYDPLTTKLLNSIYDVLWNQSKII